MEVAAACRDIKQHRRNAAPKNEAKPRYSTTAPTAPDAPPTTSPEDGHARRAHEPVPHQRQEAAHQHHAPDGAVHEPLDNRLEDLSTRLDNLEKHRLKPVASKTDTFNLHPSNRPEQHERPAHRSPPADSGNFHAPPQHANHLGYDNEPTDIANELSDALFDAIDINRDGVIDADEFAAAQAAGMLPGDPNPSMQPLPKPMVRPPNAGGPLLPRVLADEHGNSIAEHPFHHQPSATDADRSRDASPGGSQFPEADARHRRAAGAVYVKLNLRHAASHCLSHYFTVSFSVSCTVSLSLSLNL